MTRKQTEKYVQKWIDGHDEYTFIKDSYGVYWYTSHNGLVSINLKSFFTDLLQDYIDDHESDN